MIWLQTLLNDIGFKQAKRMTMFEDNQNAIKLTKKSSNHSQSKHIDIKFHHVRDAVATKKIHLENCPTQEIIVDLLRKRFSRPQFVKPRE